MYFILYHILYMGRGCSSRKNAIVYIWHIFVNKVDLISHLNFVKDLIRDFRLEFAGNNRDAMMTYYKVYRKMLEMICFYNF